jgi:hypothetical protein
VAAAIGITCDPKDDVVEVALEGLDHLIYKPRVIYLENRAGEPASLDIVDAHDVHQFHCPALRQPLRMV